MQLDTANKSYSYFYVLPSPHGCLLLSTNLKNDQLIHIKDHSLLFVYIRG